MDCICPSNKASWYVPRRVLFSCPARCPCAPCPWPAVWELCRVPQPSCSLAQWSIAPCMAPRTVPERQARRKIKVVIFFSSGFFSTLMWLVRTYSVIWELSFFPQPGSGSTFREPWGACHSLTSVRVEGHQLGLHVENKVSVGSAISLRCCCAAK